MEAEIAQKLETKVFKSTGQSSGGCISSGDVYQTDRGKVFVKKNEKSGSEIMFNGEFHGLQELKSAGFDVPSPILCGKNYIVIEYIDIKSLNKYSQDLGRNLAKLHAAKGVVKFGFDVTTCCGFIPMCKRLARRLGDVLRKATY